MKSKNNRKKLILAFIACSVLSAASISFSYLYGFSKKDDVYYSALMSLDYKVKKQSNTDFLHGVMSYKESIEKNENYNKLLQYQRLTKSQYNYFNSFLVFSNENSFADFNIIYSSQQTTDFPKSKLIQVGTYYDFDYMESIGLPLFRVSTNASKIDSKNNAELGSYISASRAEEIVSNNGMLAESNFVLEDAFDRLLDDKSFQFSASSPLLNDGEEITFSVNNIYLDWDHAYMLNDFQKSVQKTRYGNYSKSFDYWFKDSIFTFSYSVFSKGCTYVFDVRKNYGNLDRFFNAVIGYDFASKGLTISMFDEQSNVYEETEIITNTSQKTIGKLHYAFLFLAIGFFIVVACLFEIFSKFLSKRLKMLFAFLPFLVFSIFQLVFCIMLSIGLPKYPLYLFFNSTGNIIILIATVLIIVNAFIWSHYVKKID